MSSWRETCIAKGATVLWTFGAGSGNITDEIAGLVLTPSGSPTYGVTGPFPGRTAVTFAAAADFFTSPDNSLLNVVSGTIVAVVRRDTDLGTYQTMVNKGTNGHSIGWTNLDKWQIGKTGVATLANESGTSTLAAWNCYGVSHTGVASGGKVYKDGTDVTVAGAANLLVATASVLEVGRETASFRSGGSIAGLAYFPTVLSAADQLAISNAVPNADGGGGSVSASAGVASGGVVITATAKRGLVLAAGVATGSPIAYLATATGVASSGLPIGGDNTLRGVKPYNALLGVHVAAPYGLTQANAAKAAAGTNGTVIFDAIGSPYAFNLTMDVAGQTWQLGSASTQINGFTVTATGCTFEGGQVNGDITLSGSGDSFTLRNVKRQGGSRGIYNVNARSGLHVTNCEFYGQSFEFIRMEYGSSIGNIDGVLIEHSIAIRTAGASQSMVAGNNNSGTSGSGTMKNFVVHNCYFDGGSFTQGWFGIEVWGHRPNANNIGGEVRYSDLRGGQVLISMVGSTNSQNNWVHHNKMSVNVAFATYECTGNASNFHTGALLEYNIVTGPGSGSGTRQMIFSDSNHSGLNIRFNKLSGMRTVVESCGNNDRVTDNCLSDVPAIFIPTSNCSGVVINNNTANGCSF